MASGIPDFIVDLRGALGALRRYDDGRNFPIPAFWEEETRRFCRGTAQQRRRSDQPTPVFSRGLATIAERSLLRVQRYFSRRIHSAARDRLIQRVHDIKENGRSAILPATGEPAWRAYNRLTQLQGPLSGSFLKVLPVPWMCFLAGTPYRLAADATLASRIGPPSPPGRGLPRGGGDARSFRSRRGPDTRYRSRSRIRDPPVDTVPGKGFYARAGTSVRSP